jgi:hypothetical protein
MAVLSAPSADELITDVRNLLNQPSSTNSFWTDEEILSYINEAIRRYFTEVVQTAGGQFNTTDTLDVVAGTETVALPADFFEVRAVYRAVSGGYEIMSYRNNLTSGYSNASSGGGDMFVPSYYLRGNSLVLRPVPNVSETDALLVEYVQFPETILTGGDSMTSQVSPVFRDMVVTYAVYKAKLKESLVSGVDTSKLARENLNDLFTVFKDTISKRSYNPTFVQPFSPEEES